MAYLNVRERRIEAKIAYVGPQFGGKGANFAHLRQVTRDARVGRVDASTSDDGEQLSVAWHPPDHARFRDCDVHVKIVSHRGPETEQRFGDVLSDVDGVVLVVDAHPLAQTRNRAALVAVRAALERSERRAVPVVLQINKTDLRDALSTPEVVSALDASGLPHVAASAVRGEGVVETLEAAMNHVFASMHRESEAAAAPPGASGTGPTAQGDPPGNPTRSEEPGHPLLAALRQLLRDTVREHVAELEGRMVVRIEDSFRAIAIRLESDGTAAAAVRDAVAGMVEVLEEVSQRTTALTDRAHATLEEVREIGAGLDAVGLAINQSAVRVEDAARALRVHAVGVALPHPLSSTDSST